jgi:hypothetical protein
VPVDDTHTMSFGFGFIKDDGPSERDFEGRRTPLRSADSVERAYEDRQRVPGDYEAQESQRPIAVHRLEHLASTDEGVIMVRKLVREGIRAVQGGELPPRLEAEGDQPIPTHCQISVVRVERGATPERERAILRDIGRQVAAGRRLEAMKAVAE